MTISEFENLQGSDYDRILVYLKMVLGYDPIIHFDEIELYFDFYDNSKIKITSCYWRNTFQKISTDITNYMLLKKLNLLTED